MIFLLIFAILLIPFASILIRFLLLFSLFFTSILCYGQNSLKSKEYTYSIGGYISKGFIMMHDKEMGHLAQSHPKGFSLFLKKNTYGNRLWEQHFKYPNIGISFHYVDYQSPILGKTFSAMGNIDYYIIRKKNRTFQFQFGFGLGYSTNPYDKEINNKNIAIGSHFTYAALIRFAYTHQIAPRLNLDAGIKLSHFSNGAFKMPNKGINVVTADLGFSYNLNREKLEYQKALNLPAADKKVHYSIALASGIKEIDPVGSEKFSFFTLSMYASKQTTRTNEYNIGLDVFYSFATKEEIKIDRDLNGANPDFKRLGIVGGHSLLLGKLSILTQLGVYIYKPYKSDKPVYQRYGFKYAFHKQFFGAVYLKTHYAKADAVEWTIGFKL